jgi:hypothetical protein
MATWQRGAAREDARILGRLALVWLWGCAGRAARAARLRVPVAVARGFDVDLVAIIAFANSSNGILCRPSLCRSFRQFCCTGL